MAKRARIEIKCADDLLLIMEDIFNDFTEPLFYSDKHTYPVDDCWTWEEEGITRLYYKSTADMLKRYVSRLRNIFEKHFPDDQFIFYSDFYKGFNA